MKLSIQFKLIVLLSFFVLVFFGAVVYGLYGVRQISDASFMITRQEIPLAIGIQKALVTLLEAKVALEDILQIAEFKEFQLIQQHEAELFSAIVQFDSYTSAITWGSESEVFAKSEGGLNARIWNRLDSTVDLVIERSELPQAQRAALADLYFGGFVKNALKAVATHKRLLRFNKTRREEAEKLRKEEKQYVDRAVRFSELTVASLSEIVRISSDHIRESEQIIGSVGQGVRNRLLIVFVGGSIFSLLMGSFVVRRGVVGPLTEANRRLKEILYENYASAKLLVQKDRELTATNRVLEERNKESDETAKMLVRRDLELTLSNERLYQLDEAKSQFVSVAAHQLRTPLSGVKWTLYTLMREEVGALNKEQKNLIEGAYKANERLIALISDLMDVARLEEGRFGFEFRKEEFAPLVKEVKKKFAQKAHEKGITLSLRMPKNKLHLVLLDKDKIAIALENLVDNAIKYTPPGGNVALRVIEEQEKIIVEIKDTGIGISKKETSRLFTKFFRAANAKLFQTSGTGLGLYVAKNIVEHHGGAIFFHSEENKGSTFALTLPVLSPDKKKNKKNITAL
ncbi:MAG: putative Histidine kinase [Parcubacteria group bacterium Gr01-1014_48]|nr:MAG: putative Histidine kinase [Parcubacteria group bacterium Gr01-1014_48]